MKITIVLPALMRDTFSAGIACLMIYARELSARGHDHRVFFPDGAPPEGPFTVVTGRGIRWKGFAEGAEAIRLARRDIPNLHWRVYGGAALPPPMPWPPTRMSASTRRPTSRCPEAMARALVALHRDSERRARIARQALEMAAAFTWTHSVDRFEELISNRAD